MLAAQGFDVVCATISLFHSVQRWNRANIPNYFEIYLRVPFEELTRRDSKGIYSHALGGSVECGWAGHIHGRARDPGPCS